jgi:hypothetical protein
MGKRGRKCSLCADASIAMRADSFIASGISFGEIAATLGVSKFVVSRHRRHSTSGPQVAVESSNLSALEQSENRLRELSQRAEQSWLAAAASGDARGALDILKSQIRLEVDRHSRLLEQEQISTVQNDSSRSLTVADLDEMLHEAREQSEQRLADAVSRGEILCPVCGQSSVHPSVTAERMRAYGESRNALQC